MANRLEGWMVLYQGRWEEEGETDDDGHVPADFKLRNDQAPVQHAARVSMPASRGRIQGGGWTNRHQELGAGISSQPNVSNVKWLGDAEDEGNKEEIWTCSITLSLQIWKTVQATLPRMARNDWNYV